MKLAVHFGAGNIGRGFVAPILQANDYKVIFVDVNTDLVKQINEEKRYTITSLSIEGTTEEVVQDVEAINLEDSEYLNETLLNADIITTSVGPKFLRLKYYHNIQELFYFFFFYLLLLPYIFFYK